MKNICRVLNCCLVLAFCQIILFSLSTPHASAKQLFISQFHSDLGMVDITSSKEEALVYLKKSGCYIYCTSVDKPILITCPNRKLRSSQTLTSFDCGLSRTLKTYGDIDYHGNKFKIVATGNLDGLATRKYAYRESIQSYAEATKTYLPLPQGKTSVSADVLVVDDPACNACLVKLLPKFSGAPPLIGLPTDFVVRYGGGAKYQLIKTIVCKISKVDKSLKPSINGLSETNSTRDLFYGDGRLLDEFLK